MRHPRVARARPEIALFALDFISANGYGEDSRDFGPNLVPSATFPLILGGKQCKRRSEAGKTETSPAFTFDKDGGVESRILEQWQSISTSMLLIRLYERKNCIQEGEAELCSVCREDASYKDE